MTAAPVTPATPATDRVRTGPRSALSLTLLHARFQFLETVRVPIAVLGNMLFPSLALLFFVVPQRFVADDPGMATAAVAQLATFAIASACLFSFGVGVAEDRAMPFDPYLRTLPAGAVPQLAGRVLNGFVWCYMALVPLVVIGALLTAATLTPLRALGSVVLVPVVALPFLLLGLSIGYTLSSKAAIAVVQAVLFPLAFAGGLFMPPETFPRLLQTISQALPTRAARDLVVDVTTGYPAYAGALPVLVGWTVLFGVLAVTAYRRDEGRRFR
jgi:ABC-2 type transport system permease protein